MTQDSSTSGNILLFQSEDGKTRIEVRLEGETVWLSQRLIAELYQVSVKTVNEHVTNIYDEGELAPGATIRKFRIVQTEGKREVTRFVDHYSLDAILAVGYRVRSDRGTKFRQWATERLREYLVKGFTMDDERLKRLGGGNYFDELLVRVRDIRSSERVFWRKVLDIYATSIDYDPSAEASKQFFATVQNKMHWAIHGRTAAEIISERADAAKSNMGLTSWSGSRPKRADAAIAKNYLTQEELKALNLVVSSYLDFAELQALNRKPMHMKDWIAKLDDFLRISDREILSHAGRVSHDDALKRAELEYDKFRATQDALPQPVDQDFEKALAEVKGIGRSRDKVSSAGDAGRSKPQSRKLKLNKKFKPLPRDEGDEFYLNGIFEFNVTKILAFIGDYPELFPVENVPIASLDSFSTDHLDEETIRTADLSKPIVLAEIAPGLFNVIDGNHRLEKARRSGSQTIPASRIFPEQHCAFLTSIKAYEAYVEYWNEKLDGK